MKERTAVSSHLFPRQRPGDPRLGEWVAAAGDPDESSKGPHCVVLLGYPDDRGVRENRGRAGASEGPNNIRKFLYSMTHPADRPWPGNFRLYDAGNALVSSDLAQTHEHARKLAAWAAEGGRTGIALGGGHDFAAPTFQGFCASTKAGTSWGLINVDPHLDTREMEGPVGHSGNPFRVLLDQAILKGPNLVQFGARPNRNTHASWEYCRSKKVRIVTFESIRRNPRAATPQFLQSLRSLTQKVQAVGVTIDMDCCYEAEGTSAAPVLGFSAWELCEFAFQAGMQRRVRYLEVAETAPGLDPNQRSSRIAAEVVYSFLDGRARLAK